MAEAILSAAEEEAEAEAEIMPEVRQRRAPDHTPAVLRFIAPPDSPEGEGRAYTMPFTSDRERWKRFLRGATDARGVFPVEIRNRNQSIIGRDSIEVEPEHSAQSYAPQPQTGAAPTAPQYAPPPAAPQSGSDTAQVISSFADSFVNINRVMKDSAEKSQPDLEQIVSKLAEVMKPAQPPPPPQKTAADTVNEIVSIVGAVDRLRGDKTPPPAAPPKDPAEMFLDQLTRFRNISEELGPQPESKGWGAQLGSLFEGIGRGVEKIVPAIPSLISVARVGAQMLTPPQPQPQPGAEGQQQTQQQAQPEQQLPPQLLSAARALATEVTRDNIEKGADIVLSLSKADPLIAAELQQLFSAPSVSLVEWLADVSGSPWLKDLPHGVAYFDALKEELSERNQGEQPEEDEGEGEQVKAEANGHSARGAGVM